MKVILASRSKYKKKLLKSIVKDFRSIDANIDESIVKEQVSLTPAAKAKKLATLKAEAVLKKDNSALVIGADHHKMSEFYKVTSKFPIIYVKNQY